MVNSRVHAMDSRVQAPVGSVDFSRDGGLCPCRPNKCMNCNPCVNFPIERDKGVRTPSGALPSGQAFDVYVNYHVDKTKGMAFFMEEPGPGCGELKMCCMLGLFTMGACFIPLTLLQIAAANQLRKSMGLFFILKNGKVKCTIYDKRFCCGELDPVILENVCDLRVVVDRTIDLWIKTGPGHQGFGHFCTYFLAYEIQYVKPDGTKAIHLTRPLINQMIHGTIKNVVEPFVFGVRELISRSDLRVHDANNVPDIFKPTNYVTQMLPQQGPVTIIQYVHPLSYPPPQSIPQGQMMERYTNNNGELIVTNGGGTVEMATAVVGYDMVSTQDSNMKC